MKITKEDVAKYYKKLADEGDCTCLRISGDGTLELIAAKKLLISDFVLCVNGTVFAGSGFQRYSNQNVTDAGVTIGLKTPQKLLLTDADSGELVTKKKGASKDCCFLLYAMFPEAIELSMVCGKFSSSLHTMLLPKGEALQTYCKTLMLLYINAFAPEAASSIHDLFGKVVAK